MKKYDHRFGLFGPSFAAAFIFMWVVGALASLVGTGLVLYILYRIATHPW